MVASQKKNTGRSLIIILMTCVCQKKNRLSKSQGSQVKINVEVDTLLIKMLVLVSLRLDAFLDAILMNTKILLSTVAVLILIRVTRSMDMVLGLIVGMRIFLSLA